MGFIFPFRPDVKITEVLGKGSFTLSAEIIPPRNGAEQIDILKQIQTLIEAGAEFLAVTKGAGGSLRGGSLPIAQVIKEQFHVPCIAHFTCRDLLPVEIENSLMDHHYFGVRNILALRGDPPQGENEWKAREGGYQYAHQLITQIKGLNSGVYISRPKGPTPVKQESTQFCIGTAVYPDYPDIEEQTLYLKLKVAAGADYGITDMLFDPESYAVFIENALKNNIRIPLLPGTRLLKSKKQVDRMVKKFKVRLPPDLYQELPDEESPDTLEKSVTLFLKFVDRLKAYGAPGVHLFVISDTSGAAAALKQLAAKKNQGKTK